MNRRKFLVGAAATVIVGPKIAEAAPTSPGFPDFVEIVRIPQFATDPSHYHTGGWVWKVIRKDGDHPEWTLHAIDPPEILKSGLWTITGERQNADD
jgi:hypothetical protein